MLTPERTEYLSSPGDWRKFDPALFEKLRPAVESRSVRHIRQTGILRGARFCEEVLKGGRQQRKGYFDDMLRKFVEVDLIFFDPDNGLAPPASKSKNKWLHTEELRKAFRKGHSVLVIQFPLCKKHWIEEHIDHIRKATRSSKVYAFRTRTVVFFLAMQRRHADFLRRQIEVVKKRWGASIAIVQEVG